ncbi:MAG: hypothetical protein ACOX3H_06875 [Saccharofermentanales bacterium]|jgi:hypothetical protein
MAIEKSRFFDSVGDDRIYQADQFAEYFRMLFTDGILNGGTNLKVTAPGTGMQVKVDFGMAMIQGYGYWLEDDGDGDFIIQIPAADTQSKIVRIVARLDRSLSERTITIQTKSGTPAFSPKPPALERTGNIYEISLARILVPANTLKITSEHVTDERYDPDVCGLINSLIKLDPSDFERQANEVLVMLANQGYLPIDGKAADSDKLDGKDSTEFATKAQGTKADGALQRSGGRMTGDINMLSNQIGTDSDPTNPRVLARKNYVDNQVATKADASHNHDGRYATYAQGSKADGALQRSGGRMTGDINMLSNQIGTDSDPTNPRVLARKNYVDNQVATKADKTLILTNNVLTIANDLPANEFKVIASNSSYQFPDKTTFAVFFLISRWAQRYVIAHRLDNSIMINTKLTATSNWSGWQLVGSNLYGTSAPSKLEPGQIYVQI